LKKQIKEKDIYIKQMEEDKHDKQLEIERLKFFIERIENDRGPLERELEKSEQK
jgi:hypothetical protein